MVNSPDNLNPCLTGDPRHNWTARISEASPGQFVLTSGSNGTVGFQITSTNPADYVRDIHVVREDQLAYFDAGIDWNPQFVEKVEDFHTFRFMDMMNTNAVYDANGEVPWPDSINAANIEWADRPLMTDAQWSKGVPVEAMAGADGWFNMPSTRATTTLTMPARSDESGSEDVTGRVHVVYNTQAGLAGPRNPTGSTPRTGTRTASTNFNTTDHNVVRSWWSNPDGGFDAALASLQQEVDGPLRDGGLPVGQTLSYSIIGGADSNKFTIGAPRRTLNCRPTRAASQTLSGWRKSCR